MALFHPQFQWDMKDWIWEWIEITPLLGGNEKAFENEHFIPF